MGVCGSADQPSKSRVVPRTNNPTALKRQPSAPNPPNNDFCYFTFGFVPRFKSKLFRVNCGSLECTQLTDNRLNFENLLTVQVDQDLYGYQHMGGPARLVHFTGLANAQYSVTTKAAPTTSREFPSAPTCYKDSVIFVTGGYD